MKSDAGNATLAALLLLLVSSALALGAATVARQGTILLGTFRSATNAVESLAATADEVQRVLEGIEGDAPDSLVAPFWGEIADLARKADCAITLTDLSSRFHLNSLRKNIINQTGIRDYLMPGVDADLVQERREERGFTLDPGPGYGDLFETEFLSAYATGWSYWNINTADEFTLRRIFLLRTGDPFAADLFHARIRETLKNRALIRPEKLEEFIGIRYFELLFPTVNAYPALNINLVDPWILKQLLAYPAFRVVAPAASAENLVGLRQSRPIAGDELFSLIAVDEGDEGDAETEGNYLPKEENRLFAYLGSVTWFWEIKVSRDTRTLRRVIARLPEATGDGMDGPRRYRVVHEELPW